MGAQQHLDIMKAGKIVVIDSDEPHLLQALTLHTVMYDITQAVESVAPCQFFFSFLDSSGHSETETTAVIDFNFHEHYDFLSSEK